MRVHRHLDSLQSLGRGRVPPPSLMRSAKGAQGLPEDTRTGVLGPAKMPLNLISFNLGWDSVPVLATLGLQTAPSRSYLCTSDPEAGLIYIVGLMYILGALGLLPSCGFYLQYPRSTSRDPKKHRSERAVAYVGYVLGFVWGVWAFGC